MIITRTPLRISFLGGGSDLPAFYEDNEGFVFGSTIKKYIYINVNKKFDDNIRVSYAKSEIVLDVNDLKHDIARQVLLDYNVKTNFEISSMSDVPSNGTGMGSSSSYCVGLISAIHRYVHDENLSAHDLAGLACDVEINKLKKPIGKQDQYLAAHGGLLGINFCNNYIGVEKILCDKSLLQELQDNLFLVYTGIARSANEILSKQVENTKNNLDTKKAIKDIVEIAKHGKNNLKTGNIKDFGSLLDKAWKLKKFYTPVISNPKIDAMYEYGIKSGADGGKLLGAGGGGFILFYVKKENHEFFKTRFSEFKILQVEFSETGCEVVFDSKHNDLYK